MPLTKQQQERRAEAICELRKHLRPGSTVYLILRHVSKSGMLRRVSPIIRHKKGHFLHLDHWAAQCLYPESRTISKIGGGDGVPMHGCGMDMGFELVYLLGRYLWPKGGKQPKGIYPRNGDTSGIETDGGYMLRYHWL